MNRWRHRDSLGLIECASVPCPEAPGFCFVHGFAFGSAVCPACWHGAGPVTFGEELRGEMDAGSGPVPRVPERPAGPSPWTQVELWGLR